MRKGRTHFQPLADHLAACAEAEVVLTFAEIEAIIGGPLSVTAQVSPAWWSATEHAHTRTWHALGWRSRLEQRERRVRFTRVAEEQRMPSGHKTSEVPSTYQPLLDLLAEATGDEVVLTYRQIAARVGPLPEQAILTSYWWIRDDGIPATLWRALGWRAHADRDHRRVIFTRDAEEG